MARSNFFGHIGEWLARLILRCKGYKILHKNYASKLGEIDIIAVRGKQLCFIEVKSRQRKEDAYFAISPYQMRRIENSAKGFIAKHQYYRDYNLRFDAFYVSLSHFPSHIKNILETT